jgi:gamma-glutamyl-gamma-aminobutyraldehyde dehydrogenase
LLFDNATTLAATISVEMGKPVREALQTEIRALVNCFRWYSEAADKMVDEAPVTPDDVVSLVTREPVGVVAAIVPWNFPLTMMAWKVAPALMMGNSVVLKPAEYTPYSALMVAALALEAGIPPGVLNVLPGEGAIAGEALARHMDVDVIAFTGSGSVGRGLLRHSGESNGKRVWLELGGKTPSIVLPDADLEKAVRAIAGGCFYNQGQMCTASSRLIVHRSQVEHAAEIAADEARATRPADPFAPGTGFGALASQSHLARVSGFVERAIADGATLMAGGNAEAPVDGGSYFQASVLAHVDSRQEIAREEVFGPVLSILSYDTEEEALAIANSTPYGLAASVWTNDLSSAHRASRNIEAGVIWINCFEEGDMTFPFGGIKASGYGRDKSLHAVEKFSNLKSTWIQL